MTQLDTKCTVCGTPATWEYGPDEFHILGPQHPLVKRGLAKLGHLCRKDYAEAEHARATNDAKG